MTARHTFNALTLSLIAALFVSGLATGATKREQTSPDSRASQTSAGTSAVETNKSLDVPRAGFPTPDEAFHRIGAFSTNIYSLSIDQWTIISMETLGDAPLNVFILDADGNLIDSFDSFGCGVFLQLEKPQEVTVVVANYSKASNDYRLIVY